MPRYGKTGFATLSLLKRPCRDHREVEQLMFTEEPKIDVLMSTDSGREVPCLSGRVGIPSPMQERSPGKGLSDDQRVVINAAFASFGPHWRDVTRPSTFQVFGFPVVGFSGSVLSWT